jgi:hypothetical protein
LNSLLCSYSINDTSIDFANVEVYSVLSPLLFFKNDRHEGDIMEMPYVRPPEITLVSQDFDIAGE